MGKKFDNQFWDLKLDYKPDFKKCMKRIYAWFEGEIIDRPPIRFTGHNVEYNTSDLNNKKWNSMRDKWFDVEYQVENFINSLEHRSFLGETFPIFWPNLGPSVYAAFYGTELEFGEVTSWESEEIINEWNDLDDLKLDYNNVYFKKLEELTNYALEKCENKFMVGYSDFHSGFDCLAAWRGQQKLLLDLYDNPSKVKEGLELTYQDFQTIYDYFDKMLKNKNQLSVNWLGIPSFGKLHVPSSDFSAMISNDQFEKFKLPFLKKEVKEMDHNIFHLDGKDVARHLDMILEIPEIQAIQWVQGMGVDKPILQWVPLIKKIQDAGKSVIVDLEIEELDSFMNQVNKNGIFLCIDCNKINKQKDIIEKLNNW